MAALATFAIKKVRNATDEVAARRRIMQRALKRAENYDQW